MKEENIKIIKELAGKYAEEGKDWHFHILVPECRFNQSKRYAFILENSTDNQAYVYYSNRPEMDTGKELVKLLHGKDVVKNESNKEAMSNLPEKALRIIERAKQLNKKGKFWHHHLLFPNCRFNDSKGDWMIVLEDQEAGKILKSRYGSEPKAVLKEIETLFYTQKKG